MVYAQQTFLILGYAKNGFISRLLSRDTALRDMNPLTSSFQKDQSSTDNHIVWLLAIRHVIPNIPKTPPVELQSNSSTYLHLRWSPFRRLLAMIWECRIEWNICSNRVPCTLFSSQSSLRMSFYPRPRPNHLPNHM